MTTGTILDEHGAFPMTLGSGVIKKRPQSWWPQEDAPASRTEQFELRIIESD